MPIPAAQYVRMSTEHQQYSISHQTKLIAEYAQNHSFEIVKTFEDPGRSGLSLKSRPGLKALLNEVVAGDPVFKAILVYDVSRWGRFQDVDEAAHYEFLCRNSGIPVHYCAEQFSSQCSIEGSILKTLKRVMAAEFSRDLGDKVYRAQVRMVQMGFKMGGRAPYGLRRMLVTPDKLAKKILNFGELKGLHSDHVIVVPGPEKELAVVREIFAMAESGIHPQTIAKNLNQRGIPFSDAQLEWKRQTVSNLIRNPVYLGHNVWGRTTQKLNGKTKDISKNAWIIARNVFEPIVDCETFEAAQEGIRWKLSDEEILEGLRRTWKKHGAVTQAILVSDKNAPSYASCVGHFGSLKAALERIGYSHKKNYKLARERGELIQRKHRKFVRQIASLYRKRIRVITQPHSPKWSLLLDEMLRIHVQLAIPRQTSPGHWSWRISPRPYERYRLNLCCYMDPKCDRIRAMYFLRCLPQTARSIVTIHPDSSAYPHIPLRSIANFCTVAHSVASR